jgi:hypothetical protein
MLRSELPLAAIAQAEDEPGSSVSLHGRPPTYGENEPGPSTIRLNRSPGSFDPQTHEFHLEGSPKKPLAILRLRSSAPTTKSLPIFFEGQKISGEVSLDLKKPESIKSVVISVGTDSVALLSCSSVLKWKPTFQIKGTVSVGLEERVFAQLSETIWHEEFGHPRAPSEISNTRYTGKLVGMYNWSFSISLPAEVTISDKVARDLQLRKVEHLPPNVQSTGWDSAITYRLSLSVKRHGLFRSDSS